MSERNDLIYREVANHGNAELPIALHKLSYPEGTEATFYLHWHKEFEILVLTEGVMEITIEDRVYTLQKDDVVFINSDMYHSAHCVDGRGCSFFAIDFSYQFLIENLHTNFARKYIRPVLSGKLIMPEFIRPADTSWGKDLLRAARAIASCPEYEVSLHELMIKSRIYIIWDQLYSHSTPAAKSKSGLDIEQNERLAPVFAYIQENYSYEITLETLAELLPMSTGQFCRIFKKATHQTPMQYIMRYRILQSCQLLLDTDKKIGEIANLSGFNNSSYYNKIFMQIIGCSPSAYRKRDF